MPVVRVRVCAKTTPQTPYSTPPLKKPKTEEADPFQGSFGDSWYRVSCLGKGTYGTVHLANTRETHGLPRLIAVKSCLYNDSLSLQYEKQVLDDLNNCSYVIKCYGEEVTTSSGGEQVYNMLLEYCSGLSVDHQIRKIGPLIESRVRSYTRDVVQGLKYIHSHGYTHCDIKPDNILLVPSTSSEYGFMAKIADFGVATKINEDDSSTLGGTLCYMSPEQITESRIDYPVDIWALGCSMVEMLNGEATWDCSDSNQFIQNIANTDLVPQLRSSLSNHISDNCKDFISKCLARNVADRWTAKKLLKHPFLAST